MAPDRRHALRCAAATAVVMTLPARTLRAAALAPFRYLAVPEPPFEEQYEVLIALAPPLARGTVGKVLTQVVTRADAELKTERLTDVLDPAKTRLHLHFVQALADELADGQARVARVPVDAAHGEAELLGQVRERAPLADGILIVNVMGRFVAMHGLAAYAPGVMAGVKALHARSGRVWLEQVYTAGFRGIDPRASHLDVADMPEHFENVEALLEQRDAARTALIRGAEAIGTDVARRLMAPL